MQLCSKLNMYFWKVITKNYYKYVTTFIGGAKNLFPNHSSIYLTSDWNFVLEDNNSNLLLSSICQDPLKQASVGVRKKLDYARSSYVYSGPRK